ncbi:potassium transporter TrkA [Haladaptatus sp. W1]|uniref:potassium channel family protein n=1 Tax=Haladaptatus sp. W1 TaxID=1897478 RepID=UPI000849903F|nr:TrkA C-terminal domain-containing protein [Haladaptatus sp. W1]ODR81853.1 potassium transporter TrkA [Haladaptatus sp. W1]
MSYSLPVQILFGLYLGTLTGVVPALVAWTLGFVFRYVTGVAVPGFGVVVLSVAIAGVQGGLLGLLDPTVVQSPTVIVALVVVMLSSQYAHAKGDEMGTTFPRRIGFRQLRENRLSSDVIERVGRFGQVRVRATGDVGDIEGYPPLPDDLRTAIAEDEWTFPGDLPIPELESRLADRLRTDYDLADVTVEIDTRAMATVNAAPPEGSLSRCVPAGKRAVSVDTLLPTGLSRNDTVVFTLEDEEVDGTVLSAKTNGDGAGGNEDTDAPVSPTPTTGGGDGRVTVAVSDEEARRLLDDAPTKLRVESRGTRYEFELIRLLRRGGKRWERVSIRAGGAFDGQTLGAASVRATYGVAVLALERDGDWTVAPPGTTALEAGDCLYVVGDDESVRRFSGVVA